MKRIGVYLQSDPEYGGSYQYGRSIVEAVSAFPRREFELTVLYSSPAWKDFLHATDCQAIRVSGRPNYLRALGKAWNALRLPVALWRESVARFGSFHRAFRDANCDLWVFPAQDKDSYLNRVRALAVIHDLMHRHEGHFPEVSEKGQYRWRERHYRAMCDFADGILVDSQVGKHQVLNAYAPDAGRLHVLPYIAPGYMLQNDGCDDVRELYGLPGKYLFYPAHFWKHKNHAALIRAAADVRESLPDLHFVFTGQEKNALSECTRLMGSLGVTDAVTHIGYVPESHMAALYRSARALVMPTFFGPTNIPPLEAFAVGCPVAISEVYGMPEQVGDAALLFDPEDDPQIAAILRRLWIDDELCADLSRRGRQAAEAWGPDQFRDRLLEIVRLVA